MSKPYLFLFAAMSWPVFSMAQDDANFLCVNGDLQRRVEVVYEPGVSVPCEVHYYKDTEAPGESQVLWRAQSEEGFCESQARGFVEKLESWGWSCGTAGSDDAVSAGDDTSAVEPKDD